MSSISTPLEKAQRINLDKQRYGSFAEIGAGQEVVRFFFQASGSAGTVSKSISAYDMEVSDSIYGDCDRYVCRRRVEQMLKRESRLTLSRLDKKEGDKRAFFSFANTVTAQSYSGTNRCHGWMGVDFQAGPKEDFNSIIVHFNLYDISNVLQQEIVGILGINLLNSAFYYSQSGEEIFLEKLFEGLNRKRVEVDAVNFSGGIFEKVDKRLVGLHLLKSGLSHAAMFNNKGEIVLPSEEFYKKNLIVERGSFYPLTNLHLDIIQCGIEKYRELRNNVNILPIMEISMRNIFGSNDDHYNLDLFLKKTDMLCSIGANVLITDYPEYYRLSQYLQKNTVNDISFCLGVDSIIDIFKEKYYDDLTGGLFESLGRMFKDGVRIFAYPYKNIAKKEIISLSQLRIDEKFQDILEYFKKQNSIIEIDNYRNEYLGHNSDYVTKMIHSNHENWCDYVPSILVDKIKMNKFLLPK